MSDSLAIPKTQSAVVFTECNGPNTLHTDWPVVQQPDLKPGEALVKILYSGVCHSDLSVYYGKFPIPPKLPLVAGHEGAGILVAVADHTLTPLKVGDRVGIKSLATSCLQCECCREGHESACAHAVSSGYFIDGTFQQYAVSFVNHLTPIPDSIPMELAAPILCAGVTMLRALKQSNTKPGDYLLVAGAGGGLGHLAVQYAVAQGLRVVAVDTGADKKALCEGYGAHAFLDFKDEGNFVDRVKAVTGGLGPHASIVASGAASAYSEALEYLRPHGTLVAVGLPTGAKLQADIFWTVVKQLRIVGSFVGNRQDAIEALDYVARGAVKPNVVVEPLENIESIYDRLGKGQIGGRVVVKCC